MRLIYTRWSAHADATKAFVNGYTKIQQLFDNISEDDKQPQDARLHAGSRSQSMNFLKTGIMAELWYVYLERIHVISCILQDS